MVVHPVHGAGLVIDKRIIVIEGSANQYICIKLNDVANSSVMTPIDSLEKRGLREATGSFELVRDVMFQEPRKLDVNHRIRQADVRSELDDGSLLHLIQGLRDLCWHEYTEHLTSSDKQLRSSLNERLQQELAVTLQISNSTVKNQISQIIDEAMQNHAENMA